MKSKLPASIPGTSRICSKIPEFDASAVYSEPRWLQHVRRNSFQQELAGFFANLLKHSAYVPGKSADGENSSPFEMVKYWARKRAKKGEKYL